MAVALEEVVAGVLNIPVGSVTNDLEFNGVPEWDSLNHVNLMLELERVYGVAIGDDEMVDLTTVAAIRQFLSHHPAARNASVE
jgi:acyl carrier protein